jgi:hypothetical protein
MFNPLEHPGLPTGRHWQELDVDAAGRAAEPDTRGRVGEMESLQAAVAVFNRRAALLCPDLESQRALQRLGWSASTRRDALAAPDRSAAVPSPVPAFAQGGQGGQGMWAQLVVQECAACATYHALLEHETDRRLRQLWEVHLQMELADLRTAGDLLRRHEDRDPQEVVAGSAAAESDLPAGWGSAMAAMPVDLPAALAQQQHRIEQQFQQTLAASGEDRHTAFGQLAWLVAVHETIEEEIAHPLTRQLDQEDHLAEHLLDEERRISEALADVSIAIGEVDGLAAVHDLLLTHTRRERQEEFPLLRTGVAGGELRDLGDLALAVQSQAAAQAATVAGAGARPGMPQAADLVRDLVRPAAHQLHATAVTPGWV